MELEGHGGIGGSGQNGQSQQRVPLIEYGFVVGSLGCGMWHKVDGVGRGLWLPATTSCAQLMCEEWNKIKHMLSHD